MHSIFCLVYLEGACIRSYQEERLRMKAKKIGTGPKRIGSHLLLPLLVVAVMAVALVV